MTTISPSILAADFLNLQSEIESFKNEKNLWFHLDVMDGHYVPNLTFGKVVLEKLKSITDHKLDVHLMVKNPQDYIHQYKELGFHNFSFHWEAVTHHDSTINEVKKYYPSCGIAINPATDVSIIPDYIFEKINLILIMSVNPGFGGQSFIPSAIDKVKFLNKKKNDLGVEFEIQVDGGVTDKNAKELIDAGATNLVAGSYIFKADNYSTQIKSLRG